MGLKYFEIETSSKPYNPRFAMAEGAFESTWENLEQNAMYCSSCFCTESKFSMGSPMCVGSGKIFCCTTGFATGQECVGEKGLLFGLSKLCCLVSGVNSNKMAIGCCDQFCFGKPYSEDEDVKDNENDYMEHVFWCCYCLIAGYGCAPPSPMISSDVKICCYEAKASSADECHDPDAGCINFSEKICCFMNKAQFPPSMDLGLGCCVRCVGGPEEKSNDA